MCKKTLSGPNNLSTFIVQYTQMVYNYNISKTGFLLCLTLEYYKQAMLKMSFLNTIIISYELEETMSCLIRNILLIVILTIVMLLCSCNYIEDDRVFFEAILELTDLDDKDMNFYEFKDYFQEELNSLSVVSNIDENIFYNDEFGYYTMLFKDLDIVDYTDLEIHLLNEIQNTDTLSTKQYKISYILISLDDEEYYFIDYWDIHIENDKIFNGFVRETSDIVRALNEQSYANDGEIVDEQPVDGETKFEDVVRTKITYMSDGLEVFGYMTRPAADKTKLPLIVYLHGGYENEYWMQTSAVNGLLSGIASQGYVVIAPQYRGGSIGKDEMGGADLNDVINMIELAKNLDYVDAENIYLIGGSRGGLMALLLAKENIDGIKGGAITSGLYSIQFNYNYHKGVSARLFFMNEIGLETPEENPLGYAKRSATMWANKIDIPLLMIHGTDDEECPIDQVYEFITQMDRYGKEYEFAELEGEGHSLSDKLINPLGESLKYFENNID